MASSLSFVQYVCDTSGISGELSYKKMFGEYGIYYKEKMVALVCDNQLFVKMTEAGLALLPNAPQLPPYPGAKPCLLIETLDDPVLFLSLIQNTYQELPLPKPKKKKS